MSLVTRRAQAALRLSLALALSVACGAACQSAPPPAPPPEPVFPTDYDVVDLTRPLDADTPFLPHARGFRFERVVLDTDARGRVVGAWSVLDTMGTHLETPTIFGAASAEASGGILRVPVSQLVAPLRVLDAPPMLRARDDVGTPLPTTVGVARILAHEALHGRIPRGAAVVLQTGMGDRPSSELGLTGRFNPELPPHAGWSAEAIRFLALERGVRLIGTDALALDPSGSESQGAETLSPAAHAVAESGLLALSALAHLGSLPRSRSVLVVGVLPVAGASAAPVRALALVPPDRPTPIVGREGASPSTDAATGPAVDAPPDQSYRRSPRQ